jgi:chemotaxis protein methyltransferase CheR
VIQSSRSTEVERFRQAVARRLGLQFDDAKLEFLADVLCRRLDAIGQRAELYLARLETEPVADEIAALAQDLTVSETYFFRYGDQHRAFAELISPDCLAAQSNPKCLRILSAGCASGEEAYSLAVLVREAIDPAWDVSILGVDVNPAMVRRARRGRYSAWALRETPAHVQQRWFKAEGREFVLDETLRAAVRFDVGNLAQDDPQLWQPATYDIVFCRNVLMYFTHEQARATVARISRALKPGGYLFLGHAETLRRLSGDFSLQHTHETFYYQRRDGAVFSEAVPTAGAASHALIPSIAAAVEGAETWVDTIAMATRRIEVLTGSIGASASMRSQSQARTAAPGWDLGVALELLREERFTEALQTMEGLPAESEDDAEVLLLSAALLTHRGRLAEAERACRRLLDVDELNAGAHYLLALCREGARDAAGARYHDQAAIHLDPGFAMPHLHLGLLARRAADRPAAQRELGRALLLLQREEGSRLLLFGGGFGRETLVALCRTELAGCGGAP